MWISSYLVDRLEARGGNMGTKERVEDRGWVMYCEQ